MNEETSGATLNPADYKQRNQKLLTLPSGFKILVRLPGPEMALKSFRLPANLSAQLRESLKGMDIQQAGREVIKRLSDEDAEQYMNHARAMVCAVSVSPRIRIGTTDESELDPSDLEGGDFWYLYGWAQRGGDTVRVGESEVSTEEVANFRQDNGLSTSGADSGQVQESAERLSANS